MSSKDDEVQVMHSKSDSIEVMAYDNFYTKLSNKFLSHFFLGTEWSYKHQWEVVNLSLMVLIYYITNVIKYF